ncbi:Hsp20/alpha crystallin family protein [Marixanthomonas sp. SCSIO 43207]|uniref:Hsp20/alpha crystallin family protein n=1 Tax=Marixanthomonas sp. SCSIO 43207 TaxID=2779360 RepID=UPI001CA8992E|nr:Hsp20/alpha crystallin family protein [Marixanthomonas sp. SCSIO 43207]UAB81097.1 Hsp20/alpha crystallin family protein [Marixanthomonas sp. SCSIO 43207]
MNLVRRNNNWFPSLLDELFTENKLDVPNYENFSIPAVNIQEKNTNFVVQLAVPGLKKENFNIEVEDDVLKISAEVSSEKEEKNTETETKFTRKEFNYSSFKRSFTLPENVNVDEVNATYKEGVLEITLPKKEEEKALKRMVEIS